MGDVTSPDGLPYPFDTDVPDIPGDFQGLAEATQAALLNGVTRFASETDRDGNITSPTAGMQIYVEDLDQYQGYSSSQSRWLPIGGLMPYGFITTQANQAVTGTTKLTYDGAVATTRGGVTWSTANASYSGPPGRYLVIGRCIARAASGDGHLEMGFGNSEQMGSAYGGGFIGSGYEAWVGVSGTRAMTVGATFSQYIRPHNVNRSVGYGYFQIIYMDWGA